MKVTSEMVTRKEYLAWTHMFQLLGKRAHLHRPSVIHASDLTNVVFCSGLSFNTWDVRRYEGLESKDNSGWVGRCRTLIVLQTFAQGKLQVGTQLTRSIWFSSLGVMLIASRGGRCIRSSCAGRTLRRTFPTRTNPCSSSVRVIRGCRLCCTLLLGRRLCARS